MEEGLQERRLNYKNCQLIHSCSYCNAPEKSIVLEATVELPATLRATTLMVYVVPSCSPLSSVLVVGAVVCTGVDPPLGTLVTVYPVTGGLLADNTGGVHVTVMDEAEEAVAVTPVGGEGTAWKHDRKKIKL